MFSTPVVYTAASVLEGQPQWVQILYGLNPMAGVVEAFRWALLGGSHPQWIVLATSVCMTLALLVGGLLFFRRLEPRFADLV
jgi:lipopolysaccharide transport system permease protein